MKGHKFLIVVGSYIDIADIDLGDLDNPDIQVEEYDPCLTVVTCTHENFSDNVVQLPYIDDHGESQGLILLRDIDGKLYYYVDFMTKLDVINAFE